MVNEANLAATELKRDIKFNTKLVKKLDPFLKDGVLSQGKTDVVVKVDNNEEQYFYEWPAEKFQNRLFMIREILDQFFDDGDMPVLDKNEDPFWDPPNPILIGQSFIQLSSLAYYMENQLEAAILSIDGAGGKNGMLQVSYQPCTDDGNTNEDELPEEFLVDEPSDLIGLTDLCYKINVTAAKGLPKTLCNNAFVTYQMKYDKNIIHQTWEFNGKNQNPAWNYSQVHKIDTVTSNIVEELQSGSISF